MIFIKKLSVNLAKLSTLMSLSSIEQVAGFVLLHRDGLLKHTVVRGLEHEGVHTVNTRSTGGSNLVV